MKTERSCNLALSGTVLLCAIFFSCSHPLTLSGQIIKNTRDLPAFSAVSLAISADVYISQGNQQMVEIEADKDVIDIIETDVRGDELVIKMENFRWRNLGQVKVYITMPEIHGFQVSGSGDVQAQTPITTDEIQLGVSGSGTIEINELETVDVSISITGSGDIRLGGIQAEGDLDAVITGSGDFLAEEFEVATAHVNITGSGTARINVTDELVTNITGSGDVHYKGDPLINANSVGSGRTTSIN